MWSSRSTAPGPGRSYALQIGLLALRAPQPISERVSGPRLDARFCGPATLRHVPFSTETASECLWTDGIGQTRGVERRAHAPARIQDSKWHVHTYVHVQYSSLHKIIYIYMNVFIILIIYFTYVYLNKERKKDIHCALNWKLMKCTFDLWMKHIHVVDLLTWSWWWKKQT